MSRAGVSLWSNTEFRSYLSSVAFSGIAIAMHQLLVAWLLIGVLLQPADRVGLLQAAIGLPGVLLMLWGGASADRTDPRSLLIRVYSLAPVFPLLLVLVDQANLLAVWNVALWGLGMGFVISFSSPAQQAILNRVSGSAVQQGVTAATAIGFSMQLIGLAVAGQLDRLGLTLVLLVQALCLAATALLVRKLSAQPAQPNADRALRRIADGIRATYRNRVVFDVLMLNFLSSIFNAGAFLTVVPFIIKRIYNGNAALLATMMAVFFAGAMVSNLVMLRLMPIARPGRWFVLMQLSRIVILFLLWIEPSWWLLVTAIIAWGLNMGVTSTLARAIVQERAEPEFRGRILSVYTLSLLGSPSIGAVVLGWMIETFGTLNALLPAMATSLFLFLYSVPFTDLWSYRSPTVAPARQ